MTDWTFIVSTISLIFSIISFMAAVGCIAYTVGLRNSTHQISYVPLGGKPKNGDISDEDKEDVPEELEEQDNF